MTRLAMTRRNDALRSVLLFVLRHWRRQPGRIALIAGAITLSVLADIVMPVYVGRLVDAMAADHGDRQRRSAPPGLPSPPSPAFGVASLVFRHVAWMAIIPFSLRVMGDVAQTGIAHVPRLSTDWHAFAGSVVRKITRGMGSIDQLHDVLLLALLPSAAVLIGAMVLFGLFEHQAQAIPA